jgi:hypothetical protein
MDAESDLEEELAAAIRRSEADAKGSIATIICIRDQAFKQGNQRLATGCLKALGVLMPAAEWVTNWALRQNRGWSDA